MATATGNSGVVKLVTDTGGADTLLVVGEIRSFSIEESADTIESTVMGDYHRSYLVGNKSATVSIECYFDPTDDGQAEADDAIRAANNAKVDWEILPTGAGSGKKYTGIGIMTGRSISASADGMIEASFSIQCTGAITEADA